MQKFKWFEEQPCIHCGRMIPKPSKFCSSACFWTYHYQRKLGAVLGKEVELVEPYMGTKYIIKFKDGSPPKVVRRSEIKKLVGEVKTC